MNIKTLKRLKDRLLRHKNIKPPQSDAPIFNISINKLPLDSKYQVTSITINKQVNKISSAHLEITDGDVSLQEFTASNSGKFNPGNEVEIFMGGTARVFKGIIIKHSIQHK